MTLEELKIVISAQTEPLVKGMEQVKKQLGGLQTETNKITSGIQSSFKKLLGGIIALQIGRKIGQAITGGIKDAMNVEAALQQIRRIMGESTNQFLKWADTQAIAFNMSKAEVLKYGSVFGNLLMTFTKSSGETMKYTEDLLKASSIIASATGRTMTDVMERIRSGLLGNTEAIEDLGVNVNVAMIESTEAFRRFANGRSWQQIDFQTQQQIRLMAILEQTTMKYGDSISQNTASSQAQFLAQLKNIQLYLGQAFLPIYNVILPALTTLASKLAYIMSIVAQFSQALFGKPSQKVSSQAQATNKQTAAVGGLGKAYKEAGKEAQKAQGFLAGFDEVNTLAENSNDEGSSGGGADPGDVEGMGGMTPIDFDTNASEISSEIQAMADNVRAKIKGVTDFISSNKEIIISAIGGIVAAFLTFETLTFLSTLPEIIVGVGGSLSVLLTPIGLVSMAVGALVASFLYLYQTNNDFKNDINKVWSEISETMSNFINNTLIPIFNYIVNDFLAPLGKAFKDYILPVLAELFVGVGKILNDIIKLLQSTVDNLWSILKPALDLIKLVITDTLEIIKKLWDKHGKDLIANIQKFIQGVQETFQLLWDNVLKPIIKPFLEMLSWLWTEHLSKLVAQIGEFIMKCVNGALELYNGFIKPIIDSLILEFGPAVSSTITFVLALFGSMLAGISDIITGLIRTLGGIIDFIVGVFTGNWEKAWNGVKDIFGGIFDSLVGLVKAPLNYIIDAINFVIRGLNRISIDIPDWVSNIIGVSGTWGFNISQIPKLARGGIVDGPTVAMIGEAGKEAVVPLENTSFVDKLASALGTAVMAAMQFSNSKSDNNSGDIILELDGTIFARLIKKYMDSENKRQGGNMIIQTI